VKKTSFSYSLLSHRHPDKLLKDHLKNVGYLSREIISSKYVENKELFSNIAYLIGISHDFGKGTTFFQNMLTKGEKSKYSTHGFLSALFGYYITKEYLKNENKLEAFWYLPVVAWVVIKKHHGDITDIGELDGEISKLEDEREMEVCLKQMNDIIKNCLSEVKAIYGELAKWLDFSVFINLFDSNVDVRNFAKEIRNSALKISRENDIKYYFDILFFYSILLDADKLDASGTSVPQRIDVPKDLIDRYKKIEFGEPKNEIDTAREEAYKEVNESIDRLDIKNERILSINLPTGLGKTLTGISFALKLREKIKDIFGFTPRVIYSLPFLSIIEQNGEVIEKVFRTVCKYQNIPSNLFLKHHHLADIEYREERDSELKDPIENINKALLLTEGWHSEIVITTFVQLFHSIITNRNRAARKFHNIVNSIIILDEVQSIPTEYWLLINKALTYLSRNFNCWVILMTATEPLIFEKDKEIKNLLTNKKNYFTLFNRYMCNFDLSKKNLNDFSEQIFNEIKISKDKNIMVVLNTIDSCKKIYEYIKKRLLEYYNLKEDIEESIIDKEGICVLPDMELINLSTHILPFIRLNRINRIKDKKDNKRKIIITTQLIEAGVDISVDVIYRDMAPLDCIIQTAGRCNRNNEKQGIVNVVLLEDDNTQRPYWSYIYDSVLIDATQEIIEKFGKSTTERNFILNAEEEYYSILKERKNKGESEKILRDLQQLNFNKIVEFKLIKEFESVSIFVEFDEKAEGLRKELEEIFREKNSFEKLEKLLRVKKDINQYILSIKLSKREEINQLKPLGNMDDFRYIPLKSLKDWYKSDTGFYVPELVSDFMIN